MLVEQTTSDIRVVFVVDITQLISGTNFGQNFVESTPLHRGFQNRVPFTRANKSCKRFANVRCNQKDIDSINNL